MENQLCTLAPVDAGAFSLVCKVTRILTGYYEWVVVGDHFGLHDLNLILQSYWSL